MKSLIRFLLIIIVLLVLAAGFTGLVPGLSALLGTDKPKDFGIRVTPEDTKATQEKSGVILEKLPDNTPPEQSFRLEGSRPASFTYDSKEATAIINNRPWKYYPFSDLQLRINPDGTIETSGKVDMNLFMSYANSLGYKTEDVSKALNDYNIPKINMPFYVKGTGSVIDNKIQINVQSFQAGKIPVPSSILSQNQGRINSFAQDALNRIPNFTAKKLVVENEKIVYDGTMPEKEYVVYK